MFLYLTFKNNYAIKQAVLTLRQGAIHEWKSSPSSSN